MQCHMVLNTRRSATVQHLRWPITIKDSWQCEDDVAQCSQSRLLQFPPSFSKPFGRQISKMPAKILHLLLFSGVCVYWGVGWVCWVVISKQNTTVLEHHCCEEITRIVPPLLPALSLVDSLSGSWRCSLWHHQLLCFKGSMEEALARNWGDVPGQNLMRNWSLNPTAWEEVNLVNNHMSKQGGESFLASLRWLQLCDRCRATGSS